MASVGTSWTTVYAAPKAQAEHNNIGSVIVRPIGETGIVNFRMEWYEHTDKN